MRPWCTHLVAGSIAAILLVPALIGLFAAQDLLLFYLFFEVGLVPMYFIVGIWGGERRRYAALKFFLYTRAGSLAMLLGFLALYLAMEPHTFSLQAIARAKPLDGPSLAGSLAFLALLAALVGPFVIDWNQFRGPFEAEATRLFGAPVRVASGPDGHAVRARRTAPPGRGPAGTDRQPHSRRPTQGRSRAHRRDGVGLGA